MTSRAHRHTASEATSLPTHVHPEDASESAPVRTYTGTETEHRRRAVRNRTRTGKVPPSFARRPSTPKRFSTTVSHGDIDIALCLTLTTTILPGSQQYDRTRGQRREPPQAKDTPFMCFSRRLDVKSQLGRGLSAGSTKLYRSMTTGEGDHRKARRASSDCRKLRKPVQVHLRAAYNRKDLR